MATGIGVPDLGRCRGGNRSCRERRGPASNWTIRVGLEHHAWFASCLAVSASAPTRITLGTTTRGFALGGSKPTRIVHLLPRPREQVLPFVHLLRVPRYSRTRRWAVWIFPQLGCRPSPLLKLSEHPCRRFRDDKLKASPIEVLGKLRPLCSERDSCYLIQQARGDPVGLLRHRAESPPAPQ